MTASGIWTPGDAGAHPARGLGGGERADADQNETTLVEAHVARLGHEGLQHREVEAILGLDELRAGVDLFGEPDGTEVMRRRERVLGRAEEDARGGRSACGPT